MNINQSRLLIGAGLLKYLLVKGLGLFGIDGTRMTCQCALDNIQASLYNSNYVILQYRSLYDLETNTNELLSKGFILYGPMTIERHLFSTKYIQVLCKPEANTLQLAAPKEEANQ